MLSSPRPILKRSSTSSSSHKHAVHFPPSPALTSTFIAHSPAHYDRSPIVVGPNICALPERGGRTYVLDDHQPTRPSKSGRLLHPRAMNHSIPFMPSLIPDLSSESDESDGFPSPHLENQEFFFGPPQHGLKAPVDSAISFLPYPPSNPYQQPSEDETIPHQQSPRRRRNDSSRRKSSSRTRSSSSSSPSHNPSFTLCDSFSSFTLRDDGCLGGF